MTLRVLHVIAEMGVGGAESMVAEMIRNGSSRGWSSAVASSGGIRLDELDGTTYHVPLVHRSVRGLLTARVAVERAATEFVPDVIVAHNVSATVVARLAAPRRPILSVFHGVDGKDYRMSAIVLSLAPTRVVAVAHAVAGRLQNSGLRHTPTSVIHNAVTPPVLPDRGEARAQLGLPGDTPIALCLARLEPQKRHDILIDAFARVRTDARLLIAGDGSLRTSIADRARPLGDRIQLLGNRSDVPTLLAAADVTVLTSDWEGLPVSVLESMASGVPVIAPDVDGLREVLGDGGGELIAPGDIDGFADSLDKFLHDKVFREEHGRRAQKIISDEFSLQTMMADYDEVLRSMTERTMAPR
ncbi:putative glycosyl transferase, group 1 [Gordonia polyisoprenivorans VH2]|uniref:Putative glycosyl transferase, group 1 n=1 Tax=Gordonia polyisoprenivorans (strain DSM 44266 / VH2) TaxID=1112204 RepID=H6N1I7_GORPV|nr:glycosyltransferase [Gordonia polyisoprenivorans]AFA72198.1 putative glycosyl transferase, group 1 [Gordonia polyisoprenivorans VH2]OZC29154.1 glycosyltransferase [Gordonia polyisoprenivorans]QUD81685.1 glycosyltransferase [Gordonia polyisoprenivorans]UZF57550.1 glycosyltransferase [Gordonia polyisoprenivorans]HCS59184.1 glycosyltransferase [Gordonia polyisoprenivorans]